MGLMEERPRSLTARAVGEVRTSAVSYDEFADMLFTGPQESIGLPDVSYARASANRPAENGAMGRSVSPPRSPGRRLPYRCQD